MINDLPSLTVPVIDRFRGEFFFLSNVSPAVTPHRGRLFPTSEHAYMAARTDDPEVVAKIAAISNPVVVQQIGREAPLISDWNRVRFNVMEEIVAAKFNHDPELAEKLLATTGSLLVEGNDWHDQTWGSCRCTEHASIPGDNALGVILMSTRMRLKAIR